VHGNDRLKFMSNSVSVSDVLQSLIASNISDINRLNAELNPICHMLPLLEAHHILQLSRIRVKNRMSVSVITF